MKKTSKSKKSTKYTTIAGFDIQDNEFVAMDDYDDCIVGVIERFNQPPIVCYDKSKVLQKLINDGLTMEGALEFWEYNQISAWVGNSTTCFITFGNIQ